MTPLKAIKQFCYLCCGENSNEVKRCTAPNCPLYPYRSGHDSLKKKKEYTEEELAVLRERMNKLREAQNS